MTSTCTSLHAGPPPSYDSVVGKLEASLPPQYTPNQLIKAVSSLSNTDIVVLSNVHADDKAVDEKFDPKNYLSNPEELAAYELAIANYLTSEEGQFRMNEAANDAAIFVQEVDQIFFDLRVKTREIDSMPTDASQELSPELDKIHKAWRSVLQDSAKFAAETAVYASRFESVILPIVMDPAVSYDAKQKKLEAFIKEAKNLEEKSDGFAKRFQTEVQDKMAAFLGTFANWQKGFADKNKQGIEKLEEDIKELKEKIDKLSDERSWIGVGAVIGTVAITAVACCFLGPIGLIAGLIGVGGTMGVVIHLSNQITELREQKEKLEKQKKELQSQVDGVAAARLQLKMLEDGCKQRFSTHLRYLANIWHFASIDATKIQACLKAMSENAEDFNIPALRKHQMPDLSLCIGLYRAVARYMQRYADGVATAQQTNKKQGIGYKKNLLLGP